MLTDTIPGIDQEYDLQFENYYADSLFKEALAIFGSPDAFLRMLKYKCEPDVWHKLESCLRNNQGPWQLFKSGELGAADLPIKVLEKRVGRKKSSDLKAEAVNGILEQCRAILLDLPDYDK